MVDYAEYVLRCALAKESWRAVQGKGKSLQGSLWNTLEVDENGFGTTFILQMLDISEFESF